MITLSRQIELLLLEHDCVIIPGFGGFIANSAKARKSDNGDDLLLPPYRVVGFNKEITSNDGLLVQAYMDSYDANYPDAYRQMEDDVEDLKRTLDETGYYTFEGLGVLNKDLDNKINFTANEAGALTPSLYGLYSVQAKNVAVLERERELRKAVSETVVIPIQTTVDDEKVAIAQKGGVVTPNEDKQDIVIRLRRRWVDIAAACVVGMFLMFLFAYPRINNSSKSESDEVVASAVSVKPDAAVGKTSVSMPQTSESPAAEKAENPNYVIVMASKVKADHAEDFVNRLAGLGFNDARVIMDNKMRRVVYSGYATNDEATESLRKLRGESSEFANAWVMRLK